MSDDFPFVENPEATWGGEPLAQNQQNQNDQVSENQMAKAIALVEQGQAIEQVLSGMFANLPENVKQTIRQRLPEAGQEKEARDHAMAQQTREQQQEKKQSTVKLFSLSMLSGFISRETIERVQTMFSKNPTLKQEVSRQGQQMLNKGVQPELEGSTKVPTTASPGMAQGKDKQKEVKR